MEDIIEIVKYLEDSGLLLGGVTEAVQNEVKEQKGELLSMFQAYQVQIYQEIFLTGRGAIAKSQGRGVNRTGKGKGKGINRAEEGISRADYGNRCS